MIEPGTRIGGLLIEDLLGRGAMGEVYRAVQVSLKRPVAVKRIAGHLVDNPDMVARFEREAQCIARIQNTNVVAIYEFGQYPDATGAQHYLLVMELVEGGRSLKSFQHGAMDWRVASSVMLQAAEGLAAAAEQGVVHRDIKPDNIMITKKGIAKLTDFGLAKAVDSSAMTMGGTLMGTPAYMPPEACRGEATDQRGDIYSLGATWYHLLSGHVPFRSDNTMAMLRAHIDEPAPNILALFPTVPEPIADLVRRCMAKKPEDRPQSAQQLANELMALVAQGIHLKKAVPELLNAPHAPAGDPSTIATMVAGGAAATAITKLAVPGASGPGASPAGASPAGTMAAEAPARLPMTSANPTAATIAVPGAQMGAGPAKRSPLAIIILVALVVIVVLAVVGVSVLHGHPQEAPVAALPGPAPMAPVGVIPAATSSPISPTPGPPIRGADASLHPPSEPTSSVAAVAAKPGAPERPADPAPTRASAQPAPAALAPSAPVIAAIPAEPAAAALPPPIAPPPPPPRGDPSAAPPPAQPPAPPVPAAVASLPPLPPPPLLHQPEVARPSREAAVTDTAIAEFRSALRAKRSSRAEAYLSSIPSDAIGFKDMVRNLSALKLAQDAAFAGMSRAAFTMHVAELNDAATQAAQYPELAQSVAQCHLYVVTIEERWKAALNRADEAISHHDTATAAALLSEVPADPATLTAPFTAKRAATAAALSAAGH